MGDSNTNKRFQDENYTLSTFQNNILVVCPKCSKRAIVKKDTPICEASEPTVSCPNCHFTQKGRNQTYRVELHCNCATCGKEINVVLPNVNEKKEKIAIKCHHCSTTAKYQPQNIAQEWLYKLKGTPTDDYFGLPLWLMAPFKDQVLWAYNYEHLDYLKKYIAASIRESHNRTHWTMIEKLPVWLSSSKNRDKLLKVITELEVK